MISIAHTITNTGKYHSVLKMTNACFLDTGYYYCIINGTTDLDNAMENMTRVYVFVKGKKKFKFYHFFQLWIEKY
jgi:hypothetical protein